MKKLLSTVFIISLFSMPLMAMGNGAMKCGQGKCGSGKCGAGKGMQKSANDYRTVPPSSETIIQKGENKMYCPVCGMTLPKFYRTNHAATDNHGKVHQYCSIVCAVEDSEVNGKKLKNHSAVDNTTLKFIESKKAYFVVGSNKPGTMSVTSKYAFGSLEAAKEFSEKNGGKIMKFDELYTMVKNNLQEDMAATKKRQAKAAMMGEKIYNKMCKKTDMRFDSVADAKTYLQTSKICGNIKGKKHQQVALFLSGKK
jgi:nitrous oxide reductase accessory protein NosL